MQRRFFLKAVAALSTVPLIKVPDFRVIEPQAILLPDESWFASIREQSAFDLRREATVYRWDLFDGTNQWGVDFMARSPSDLIKARQEATIVLAETLRAEGVDLRSLKPLPIFGDARTIRILA